MLARSHRLTRARQFDTAVRRGRRAGGPTLVVHLADNGMRPRPPQVGFVVSRGVGSAVDRNRVKRRLRHLVRDRLDRLPADSYVVVRALPSAQQASWTALARDLDRALDRLTRRAAR